MTSPIARRALMAAPAALAMPANLARAQATREFRLGLITPPAHTWNQNLTAWGTRLRDASGGRFTVTLFPSGQLGNEATMLQQLQTGALDMSLMTTSEISNRVDPIGALHAPFIVPDIQAAVRMLRHPIALGLLNGLPQAVGCVGFRYGMVGMRQILTRDVTNTLADLRGKKIRITPAAPTRDFFNIIGAAPTPLALPQIFEALSNGQIDGVDLDFESTINNRFQEICRTMLLTNHFAFPAIGLMSARVFATLSPADRDLIRGTMTEALDALCDSMPEREERQLAQLRTSNMQIRPAGPEFFGDAVAQFDRQWGPRAPALAQLRAAFPLGGGRG
ncbi:MAG: TRAP transporter substrate-binding protein [Alphaproteobacteria bacterium]|nr:TRAP transporter substrate-binding protein [Alphaproteobacteria bacterium]